MGIDPTFDPYAMPGNPVPLSPNPTMKERCDKILERHRQLKAMKAPWLYTYQLIGEYVMTRKQDFTISITPGQFLTGKIFDSTAPNANHFLASSLLGALWPNSARSFHICAPDSMDEDTKNSKEIKEYFEWVTKTMAETMDDPKCGLALALEEYFYDQGAFGVSGIYVEENEESGAETPLCYKAVDAKKITIAEGGNGFVDTCYVEREVTVRQVYQDFYNKIGSTVSPQIIDAFNNGRQEEKIKTLHAVEPRIDSLGGFGANGLPVASVHIDITNNHIMKESGFDKMPIFITRFWKTMNEVYGRSPAMEAMPDILEVNDMREASIIAIEKTLNPPLVVLSDGSLGGQTINTSAGAISVYNMSGRVANSGQKPIEPLVTVGELKDTYGEIANLQQIIEKAFFKDRLTDLNNQHEQTLGEAQIRDKLRGQSMGTVYSRQNAECFSRIIERTFDVMMKQRRLGLMPKDPDIARLEDAGLPYKLIPDVLAEAIEQGTAGYKIKYTSPAARIMRSEELAGIQKALGQIAQLAPVVPDILDTINTDKAAELLVELEGAPTAILHDIETIKALRANRAQVQNQQAQAAAREQGSLTLKHTAQAAQSAAKANIPIQALMGGDQQQGVA